MRVAQDERPHPGDHLAHPSAHVRARRCREGSIERENEVAVPGEPDVGGLPRDRNHAGGKRVRRVRIVEAAQQVVQQRRLRVSRRHRLVLERVGDSTQQVGGEDGSAEFSRQHANAQREGARHLGKDVSPEALRVRQSIGIPWHRLLHRLLLPH